MDIARIRNAYIFLLFFWGCIYAASDIYNETPSLSARIREVDDPEIIFYIWF